MHNVATRQPCGTVSLSRMAVSLRDDTTAQDCLIEGVALSGRRQLYTLSSSAHCPASGYYYYCYYYYQKNTIKRRA